MSMPRRPRNAPGGFVYHVLNRAVARHALFQKDGDYQAFGKEKVSGTDITTILIHNIGS